jgi:hypothetical protein
MPRSTCSCAARPSPTPAFPCCARPSRPSAWKSAKSCAGSTPDQKTDGGGRGGGFVPRSVVRSCGGFEVPVIVAASSHRNFKSKATLGRVLINPRCPLSTQQRRRSGHCARSEKGQKQRSIGLSVNTPHSHSGQRVGDIMATPWWG